MAVKNNSIRFAWISLAVVVIALIALVQIRWTHDIDAAKAHFIEQGHARTLQDAPRVDSALRSIYENLRTLASLPGVRQIDRHAENMEDETRITFQQIYNNLANNVDISEVYVLPIDFNPQRIDPITLKSEEPIVSFDKFIINAGNGLDRLQRQSHSIINASPDYKGPAEIESFEYAQMAQQATWLSQHYSELAQISGLGFPFISGSEVITCDNRQFIVTKNDIDRSGVVFSVPFYDPSGKLKGMVSSVILTRALRDLLPSSNLALINPGNGYAVLANGVVHSVGTDDALHKGQADPNLIYSEALALTTKDPKSPWLLWAGVPNDAFYTGAEVRNAYWTKLNSLLLLGVLAVAAALCIWLVERNLKQAAALSASLEHARLLAEKSEVEAIKSAEQFKSLHSDISTLNGDLAEKLKLLSEAQDEIIRKGRMAQLGHLVATVAHEIRNPLGGIRTTVFTLQRKLNDVPIDLSSQFSRIETGINRCDSIIARLLDFSRIRPICPEETDVAAWLTDVLNEDTQRLPPDVTVRLILNEDLGLVSFDPDRLRGCIVNLVSNAAEALTAKTNTKTDAPVIEIEPRKSVRGFEIEIRDNGPGIPHEVLHKIGEPLFTTKSFGTGLGLAAVRNAAEFHGGGLDISSQLGHGASFTIWFPLLTMSLKSA